MPQGTNRPPSDRDRIDQLQRQVASLERTVANLLRAKPRTHWSQVRLARTVDDGDYPGGGHRWPIVFLDAAWDAVDEDVDFTAKSAEPQAYALAIEPKTLAIGAMLFVEQTEKGAWMIVDSAEGLGIGETQTGGIAEGSFGTVTANVLNSDGTLSVAMDENSDPIEETVYSPFGTIAEERKIAYGRDKRSGLLFAITEKCPA